tara:strand:+ start:2328 stop:2588 length:261 start_codon:yes stop_codon:yes gene_type:complete
MGLKNIIKEEISNTPKKDYKFHEGGYLIPCKQRESELPLTDEEYDTIKGFNDNIKEMYDLERNRIYLLSKKHRYYLQEAIKKIREK